MKPAKTVRLRVSFEYETQGNPLNAREWKAWITQVCGFRPKRLHVERVEKKRGKR